MLFKANHTTPTEGDRALSEARSISERRARQEEQINSLIQSLESTGVRNEESPHGTTVHRSG